MHDRLAVILEQSSGIVHHAPSSLPALMERAGLHINRCRVGQHVLCHFAAGADRAIANVSRALSPELASLVLIHVGLRILGGETTGLVTDGLTEREINGWLAVADLWITDDLADAVITDDLTIEDVAIVSQLDRALVAAKIASRASDLSSLGGAERTSAYQPQAIAALRGWLHEQLAGTGAYEITP